MPVHTHGALTCITIRGQAGVLDLIITMAGLTQAGTVTITGAGAAGGVLRFTALLIAGRLITVATVMVIMADIMEEAGILSLLIM